MAQPGYNPMRWDCDSKGCFNVVKRPKIEVFKPCFPGKISFGDIDGIVEIGGMALLLEWKPSRDELRTAQEIMYRNLSKDGKVTAIVVVGDAKTMDVSASQYFKLGERSEWKDCDLEYVKRFCAAWAKWAGDIRAWRVDYEKHELASD